MNKREINYSNNTEQLQIMKNSFIGYNIEISEIQHFIDEFRTKLPQEQFLTYRKNQAMRDGGNFHITIINPSEFSKLKKESGIPYDLEVNTKPDLIGLGKVEAGDDVAYFIVVEWPEMQNFRQKFGLEPKDFHITIGFYKKDVFNVYKGIETLL